jgi:AcrR family transcriptional regulator
VTQTEIATKAPEERRRRILSAVIDVIRDRGFAGTRVTDIATVAGTSPGLVLYHFGSLAGALAEALTYAEDTYYAELEHGLGAAAGPVERLRVMADISGSSSPAVGDWTLWLELWVRALRDDTARAARLALDKRWRSALRGVIDEGVAKGAFTPDDPRASALRLASLMDGLAIQLALEDPGMNAPRFRRLWLDGAAHELKVPVETFRGRLPRRPKHPKRPKGGHRLDGC